MTKCDKCDHKGDLYKIDVLDECYCLGELTEIPDIALEIAITSGGIDKLSVYQGLGVTEVWFLRMEILPFRELVPHSW